MKTLSKKPSVTCTPSAVDLVSCQPEQMRYNPQGSASGMILTLRDKRGRGLRVTVVGRNKRLLPRQMDPAGAVFLQRCLERMGFTFHLGVTPRVIARRNAQIEVLLEDGKALPVDMVLLSAGAAPDLTLARQLDLAIGKAVQVELPASVGLKVVESAEGVRGDTASNVTKPAKLETGKTINVPLFIKEGEIIKIDTRTGAYMGRA